MFEDTVEELTGDTVETQQQQQQQQHQAEATKSSETVIKSEVGPIVVKT